jgi:hypothetical protein
VKIVENIKNILSKHYDQMEIYDLIGKLDTEDDMSFETSAGEMNVWFTNEGYEIEVDIKTHYNINKGFITITKDEDLKEVIPFDYEVES